MSGADNFTLWLLWLPRHCRLSKKPRPIGTALQDWGRKDSSKLALEHIEEYLMHHGEPDNSSTHERIEQVIKAGVNDEPRSPEQRETDDSAAYFYEQLMVHGRAGFLWQKLRAPRSYDYKKISTKGYDERLRMPKFPFKEKQIEAIATFVLGLVAEPPAEKYLYRPQGAAKSRIEGEKLLSKYNCTGCHMVELPEMRWHQAGRPDGDRTGAGRVRRGAEAAAQAEASARRGRTRRSKTAKRSSVPTACCPIGPTRPKTSPTRNTASTSGKH